MKTQPTTGVFDSLRSVNHLVRSLGYLYSCVITGNRNATNADG
ncbi:hypothetical protein HanIR_Chr13g0657861 [Helianthus annuus]|nr:hypothetical protein HanIR_Chr13g0657861 [Helianthus annuus]